MREGLTHKLSLCADDLLLYTSDPLFSVPFTVNILNQFKKSSGYEFNLHKSEFFPLSQAAAQVSSSHLLFRVVRKLFKYLRVEIKPTFPSLFIKNFGVLFESCKQDMTRWSNLPLSSVSRVNLIKMIVIFFRIFPF